MKEQISTAYWHEKLKQLGIIVIIPSYNNGKTLAEVITSVRFYAPEILVVNDGSTDETPEILNQEANLHIITHPVNEGKGVCCKWRRQESLFISRNPARVRQQRRRPPVSLR